MQLLRIALEEAKSSKSHRVLKHYTRLETTDVNIQEYKTQYSGLRHVKTGSDFSGALLVDETCLEQTKVVAVLQCNLRTGYIVALEVTPEYRGQGIASTLLDVAYREYGVDKLTVNKANKTAINLYLKKHYQVFKEDGAMLYMEKK